MANLESGADRPTAAQFLAANRGGGLFTETVNQRFGSYLALAACRLGIRPTALTVGNLVIAVAASTMVALSAASVAHGEPLVAVAALLLWQLAYSLDCADGQLARVTGQASAAGARVDLLSDVAVQVSFTAAISAVAAASGEVPAWLVAVFAGTWMVNLITSILATGASSASLMTSTSYVVRLVKLIRDYGAIVLAVGLVLLLRPSWTPLVMVFFSLSNTAFLVLSIMQAAAASVSAGGKLAVPPTRR